MFNAFFKEMEKNAGVGDKALQMILKHPGKTLGGIGALGLGAYLAPKLYYLMTEEEKKKRLKINNDLLAMILSGQSSMTNAVSGPSKPRPNTYDPIVY